MHLPRVLSSVGRKAHSSPFHGAQFGQHFS
jgi:hypothetical protein